MRSVGQLPEKPTVFSSGYITEDYTIQIISPLFGGGAEAGKIDPGLPIRPSSIRGHLRFWWRATQGAKFDSVDKMHQREEEIWGGMENPSPVTIIVEQPQITTNDRSITDCIGSPQDFQVNRFGSEGYVLFSAEDDSLLFFSQGISFKLTVSWLQDVKLNELRRKENEKLRQHNKPQKEDTIEAIDTDVREALCAWVNFGGIGARTRRGCGALYCESLAIDNKETLNKYPFKFFLHTGTNNADRTANDAWEQSIEPLRKFRQTFRTDSHNKTIRSKKGDIDIMVPGRSLWPEADSIRKITDCALKPPNLNNFDHSTPITPTEYFPRAEFGLPIVFHFADGPGRGKARRDLDPPDVMVIPTTSDRKDGSRMASPIITRPFKFTTGSFVPMIILLPQNKMPDLRLIGNCRKLSFDIVSSNVQNPDLSKYPNSPMGIAPSTKKERSTKGSSLEAFIAYIQEREQGFTQVPP